MMFSQTGAAGKSGDALSPFGFGFCFMCAGAIRPDASCDCSPPSFAALTSAEPLDAELLDEAAPQPDEIETCAGAIMRLVGDDGDDLTRFDLCDLVFGYASRIARARRDERSPVSVC